MSKRLILPVLIIGLLLGAASRVYADDIPLPNDTMKVVDGFGRPGDTIRVNLYIANTSILVGGYTAVLFINSNMLTFVDATKIGRSGDTLDAIGTNVVRDSIISIVAYSLFPDRPGHVLHHGRGTVAQLRFRIKPSAHSGDRTYVHFQDFPVDYYNGWSDTIGTDVYIPSMVDGNITVTGGTTNQAPVIGSIGAQEVREGQTLTFPVVAYDLDGDTLTLSASNLPPNALFPTVQGDSTVTGTFTFTPNFEQGPDTLFVTFSAADNHNNITNITVLIIVLSQPNDYLTVDSNQGGVAGAQGRDVNINLLNSRNVYGLQFDYFYDHNQINISDVVPTDRCMGLGFWFNEPDPGRIIVLIFSPGLDPIAVGNGTIVRFVTNVNTTATVGRTAINLDSALEVIDSIGTSRTPIMESGYFTVDRFGDANLDGNVSVGDCVRIVAFIIDRYVLNVREFDAADMNRDSRVNVSDLQSVIDWILQIPTRLSPISPTPLVSVELNKESDILGDIISIPLMADIGTEAAAVQYELHYDAGKLEPIDVESGAMVQNLRLDHSETAGIAKGVFYNLGGGTFGPTTGELATFKFRLKSGQFSRRDVNLSDFLIVDQASAFISSEIKGQLPSDYILNQNYPNPFNSSTKISFDLPDDGQVELSIYDVLGRKVSTVLNDFLPAGEHSVIWDGRSENGESMATGVFFYRLQSASFDETKRMLLVK
jgi:hypothetical protein